MAHPLIVQFNSLQEKITDCWYELGLMSLSSDSPDRNKVDFQRYLLVTLYAYRLHLRLALLRLQKPEYRADFQEDLECLISCINPLRLETELTGETMGILADLILLPDPGLESGLKQLLTPAQRVLLPKSRPFREDYFIFPLNVLHGFVYLGMREQALDWAEQMILTSWQRNSGDLRMHRCVVSNVLNFTVDLDIDFSEEICLSEEFCFRDADDLFTVDFYWFYGNILLRKDQRQDMSRMLQKAIRAGQKPENRRRWNAGRSEVCYHVLNVTTDNFREVLAHVRDFLSKVENGYYTGCTPAEAQQYAAIVRYELMRFHMDNQTLRLVYPELEQYVEYCRANEQRLHTHVFTLRQAYNMLSAYHLELGDYLQAEKYNLLCMKTPPPEGVQPIPSDDLLYSNLLMIYTATKDARGIGELADYLMEELDKLEPDNFRFYRFNSQIIGACSILDIPVEEVFPDIRQALIETCENLWNGDTEELDEGGNSIGTYLVNAILALTESKQPTEYEIRCFRALLVYLLDHQDTFRLSLGSTMVAYMTLAVLAQLQNLPEAVSLAEKSLEQSSHLISSHDAAITVRRIAASIYFVRGHKEKALSLALESMNNLTHGWQKLIAYLDDHKICSILTIAHVNFYSFYCIFRGTSSKEMLYDQLLRNKDHAGLAGRERNRILHLAPVDEALKKEIFLLQDQLAAAQLNDAQQEQSSSESIRQRLQSLESSFAEQFPEHVSFTEISLDLLTKVLRDEEAIIEYFFSVKEDSLSGSEISLQNLQLDIFVLRKRGGKHQLNFIQIPDGDRIRKQTIDFLDILQDPNGKLRSGEKAQLRSELYRQLLEPVLPLLDGIQTLYLAPDLELHNLPFEILYSGGSGLLQDRFRVCRLSCGRDLLFTGTDFGKASAGFVLGDPDYEAERGEIGPSFSRRAKNLSPVASLPWSREEARRVARRLGVTALTGSSATKYSLRKALPSRVIHLATHGSFDESLEQDSLYFSQLIFAGYNKWLEHHTESDHCGNGILTADEISRMDLRKTELVVLSSCMSAMGDHSTGTSQGLVSAFSAAGARWVISHIWKANDFTTPILMDAFYKAWLSMGFDVPDALQYAKQHLRTMTVAQLRMDGWLDGDPLRLPPVLRQLSGAGSAYDNRQPFRDEIYWGGFVCHKCKN